MTSVSPTTNLLSLLLPETPVKSCITCKLPPPVDITQRVPWIKIGQTFRKFLDTFEHLDFASSFGHSPLHLAGYEIMGRVKLVFIAYSRLETISLLTGVEMLVFGSHLVLLV